MSYKMPPKKKARTDNYTPRVTRSRTKFALTAAVDPEDVQNNCQASLESCAQGSGEPARKVVRTRRGSLQQLPEVAIEIQNMIFGDLEPRDLFNLSRTCKRFHAHFLDRNSEPLWRTVMGNASDLPKRPPWLSIPAYVHLLYSHFCHNCGAPNIRKIQFATFKRLCSTCVQELSVWYGNAFDTMLTAYERKSWIFGNFSFREIHKFMPVLEWSRAKNRVLKEHFMLLVKGFRAAEKTNKDNFREAISKVLQTTRNDYVARLPYANDIQDWMEDQDGDRKVDLEAARKQRFELIKARLLESGWGKELDFIGAKGIEAMSKLPVVRQSSKLTEGAWKKVLAALDKFLQDARTSRLDMEMKDVLGPRMKWLKNAITAHYLKIPRTPERDCRPQAVDLAFLPECRALLELPASRIVTDKDFAPIMPALAAQWEAERREELIKYLRPHLGKIAGDVDPLSLAIAVFEHEDYIGRSSFCILNYPAVLNHDCHYGCIRERDATLAELSAADVYTRTVFTLCWPEGFFDELKAGKTRYKTPRVQVPFRADRLVQFEKASSAVTPVARMRKIVAALGLDPARTTFDELQRHGGALRCDTCEKEYPKGAVNAWMWTAAYNHAMRAHPEGDFKWRRADEKDMKKVRAHLERLPPLGIRVPWVCALCTKVVKESETMPKHLSEVHQVQDCKKAIRDGTIYISPGRERWRAGGEVIVLREGAKGRH
ncbi:hypothetical protein C8Q78DRAFT_331913 [Trametes maxima]|nr:hypothetical protein C8Q78DRAFT_331913 [Trametes maxima]